MSRKLALMRCQPANQIVAGGDGAEFLRLPDPKEVWQADAGASATINVDLGAVIPVDTVYLGFVRAASAATWTVDATSSLSGANPQRLLGPITLALEDGWQPRNQAIALLDAPFDTRYLRITLNQGGGAEAFQAGVLAAGVRFEGAYQFRSGRRPVDLSEVVETSGGGFGIGRGAVKAAFRFTFADLGDEEVETLWREIAQAGNQHPVLLVEGGEEPVKAPQLHYGLFGAFEPYEREETADTRWALTMMDWI